MSNAAMPHGGSRVSRIRLGTFAAHDQTYEFVSSVLDSGRVSHGELCETLEHEFSMLHECRHGVVSASGTDSLRAALHALKIMEGWEDGDEVIIPATTFVATMNIVSQVGMRPVLVDITTDDFGIDVSQIEDAITGRTRCLIPVNLLGQPADLPGCRAIADKWGLKMIEDSCEAAGVSAGGKRVGSWGDVGCFSFYMAHLVTAGVGGIATTNDAGLADMMRSLLNHGRDTVYLTMDDALKASGRDLERIVVGRFSFPREGYSSRMTELQAALAIPQVRRLGITVDARNTIARWLDEALSDGIDERLNLRLPKIMPGREHSYMMYGVMVAAEHKLPLVFHLEHHGIETRDILPLVNQPVTAPYLDKLYPVSEQVISEGLYLPSHQDMWRNDVEQIGDAFRSYCAENFG